MDLTLLFVVCACIYDLLCVAWVARAYVTRACVFVCVSMVRLRAYVLRRALQKVDSTRMRLSNGDTYEVIMTSSKILMPE